MQAATPDRTLEQRLAALKNANRIRIARKEWKADAKVWRADPRDLLLKPAPEFESMKVFVVLMAIPGVGKGKAGKMMRLAMVSPSKTVSGLSERQRLELVSLLPRPRR